MACFHPLTAYRVIGETTKNGKAVLIWKFEKGVEVEQVEVSCGRCVGCRTDRSKEWAVRCIHEKSLYPENTFVTLTYSDECLPERGSLNRRDFQLFMKRLRRRFMGSSLVKDSEGNLRRPIRFFQCGEYGDLLSRPHHHACLFNFSFPDQYLITVRNGVRLYDSEFLHELWSVRIQDDQAKYYRPEHLWRDGKQRLMVRLGHTSLGDVTKESAAYVARYVLKKINGVQATEHYSRVDFGTGELYRKHPEYITMSQGIGRGWFEKNRGDLYPKDFSTVDGVKFRAPKYYDKLYDVIEPEKMSLIKEERTKRMEEQAWNRTPERLNVRKTILISKLQKLRRELENGIETL